VAVVRIDPAFARRRTAELMVQAQREIPLFHVTKASPVDALRRPGVSVTAGLLPIVTRWLTRHPLLNAHWSQDGAVVKTRVDLGVAWAHRENVLVVPALRDCAGWDEPRFAAELAALKMRSAGDAFLATDFRTPTFTVSNLGATGVDGFTSLVTPPQVAVLSVSSAALTLGIDHRALDGAYAARALVDLAEAVAA
jgi:pyruvate/2-oxoglutarate dehydrogenase complex dihydrolipoamide acyltransferase (E2) component